MGAPTLKTGGASQAHHEIGAPAKDVRSRELWSRNVVHKLARTTELLWKTRITKLGFTQTTQQGKTQTTQERIDAEERREKIAEETRISTKEARCGCNGCSELEWRTDMRLVRVGIHDHLHLH
jgi:hypothetical protein